MTWSPSQYSRFESDRTRPVHDLVAGIRRSDPRTAVDLGCGPGNSTEVLLERYPDAEVTGLDSDVNMIEAARKRLPHIAFEVAPLERWGGQADVILSNAVLQWLPDHATLLPRLVERLAPGGTIAVQMPDNLDEPAYRVMRETAGLELMSRAGGQRGDMLTADDYYRVLKSVSARVDLWRTTYFHVLDGHEAIVEWFKSSGLRPFLQALDEPGRVDFLNRYRAGIAGAYHLQPDGTVLLPFPRLFIVAERA